MYLSSLFLLSALALVAFVRQRFQDPCRRVVIDSIFQGFRAESLFRCGLQREIAAAKLAMTTIIVNPAAIEEKMELGCNTSPPAAQSRAFPVASRSIAGKTRYSR
jgi:hypothetical protein